MGINRYDKPTSYSYQSPWQADDTRMITALAASKQQQWDVEEDRRQNYMLENLQMMNKIGGGDVAAKQEQINRIQGNLKLGKDKFSDLSSPEAETWMNDMILNEKLKSKDALYADTKTKHDAAVKELNEAEFAPSHQKHDMKKRMQTYQQSGSQGLKDIYGDNEFGSVKNWKETRTIATELQDDLSQYRKQTLPNGNEGYSIFEIAPAAGFNVDQQGNLTFMGIPNDIRGTRGYRDLELEGIEAVDNYMAQQREVNKDLSREELSAKYNKHLDNWMQNNYKDRAAQSIYKNASESLSSLAEHDYKKKVEEAEKFFIKNDVAFDLMRRERYNLEPNVAARLYRLNTYGEKNDGRYTTSVKDEVIVDPADVGVRVGEFNTIISTDKKFQNYSEHLYDIMGDADADSDNRTEEGTVIYSPIRDLKEMEESKLPGTKWYNKFSDTVIKEKQNDIHESLTKMKESVNSSVEIPEAEDLTHANIKEIIVGYQKDYDREANKFFNLKDKYGNQDIEFYKNAKNELYDEIGQTLKGINAEFVVRLPSKGHNKINIDGKPYAHLVAEIDPNIIDDVFEKFKKKRKLKKIEKAADWLNKKVDVDGNVKYVMDIYKPIDANRQDMIDAWQIRHPGERLDYEQEEYLGVEGEQMKTKGIIDAIEESGVQ